MGCVHIIGAGLAGLAAAARLVAEGRRVVVHEAADQAGGRCRSYFDSKLERTIDNGNHLLMSANREALVYLDLCGARAEMIEVAPARFAFLDLASGERWTLRPNRGRLPWWIFSPSRRVPRTGPLDYLRARRLAGAWYDERVIDRISPQDPLWRPFWEPLTVAALNTAPEEGSASLLWRVLRESFFRGEVHCRPMIARRSLAESFVEPALAYLRRQGAEVQLNRRLRSFDLTADRVSAMAYADGPTVLAPDDRVICAVPPPVAKSLLPGLTVPEESRAIVNAHIRLEAAAAASIRLPDGLPFLGLLGGTAQWLFLRDDVVSLTVSAADDLAMESNDEIARRLWRDTARALGLDPETQPVIRVIKEKRATFAQTPAQLGLRPLTKTAWGNLMLAGDWTDTGYPATIESAVRSGFKAARAVLEEAP